MAQRFEDQSVVQQRTVLVEVTCDLCGKKVENPRFASEGTSWSNKVYEVRTTTIEVRLGHDYPSGGYVVKRSVDLCPDCVERKLFRWLEEQGVEIKNNDLGW